MNYVRSNDAGEPDPDEAAGELLDRYHPRASMSSGDDRMLIEPGTVLENITLAMERVDNDINTSVSIEEDVVSLNELASMIQSLWMGPSLAVHVVNTAMRIMAARYPAGLVRAELPAEYDLRRLVPLDISDQQHEVAKTVFNRRTTSAAPLTEDDITEVEQLDSEGQIQVFMILFYMFGTKVGAMKYRTGIE